MSNLKLRIPKNSDSSLILKWRNSNEVREISQNREIISQEKHEKWFNFRRQLVSVQPFWIIELSGEAIGFIRADLIQSELFEISILISPEFRFRGIGKQAFKLALAEIDHRFTNYCLVAHVHQKNVASLNLFYEYGFTEEISACEFKTLHRKTSDNR